MNNEILWAILLLMNFGLILGAYKIFGKTGLYGWIVMSTIIANIQVVVLIDIFGMNATLGNIIHATSFLATDILSEKYGRKDANRGVYLGFFTMIVSAVMMQVVMKFIPAANDNMMSHVSAIFELFPRVVFASFVAYIISQLHDTWAFEKWKKLTKGKHLWLRNNASTIASQVLDVSIFTVIAFAGTMPVSGLLEIGLSAFVLKVVVAICDTPFMYLSKKINTFIID